MAKNFTEIQLDRLYKIAKIDSQEQTMWISNGAVDVWAANKEEAPTSRATPQMTLNTEDTGRGGFVEFAASPEWISVAQNDGTTTTIKLSGFIVSDAGAIS